LTALRGTLTNVKGYKEQEVRVFWQQVVFGVGEETIANYLKYQHFREELGSNDDIALEIHELKHSTQLSYAKFDHDLVNLQAC